MTGPLGPKGAPLERLPEGLREGVAARMERHSHHMIDGCILWGGAVGTGGYGRMGVRLGGQKKVVTAHRVAYILECGFIPADLEVDHLCRVRSCVNPRHLEAVTPRENSLRRPPGTSRRKVLCAVHDESQYRWATDASAGRQYRICVPCRREQQRAYYQRNKHRWKNYTGARSVTP